MQNSPKKPHRLYLVPRKETFKPEEPDTRSNDPGSEIPFEFESLFDFESLTNEEEGQCDQFKEEGQCDQFKEEGQCDRSEEEGQCDQS
jgi:hypothetical protein